jgi:lysophospholipase L1-like esterase
VHLGSNDLFQRQDLESTVEELRRLIEITGEVRPEATILLAQIIPTTTEAVNDRIARLNARIAALAGPRVILVDAFTGFDPVRMTYDGVHPNADGEIHLSNVWLETLLPLLAEATETR